LLLCHGEVTDTIHVVEHFAKLLKVGQNSTIVCKLLLVFHCNCICLVIIIIVECRWEMRRRDRRH